MKFSTKPIGPPFPKASQNAPCGGTVIAVYHNAPRLWGFRPGTVNYILIEWMTLGFKNLFVPSDWAAKHQSMAVDAQEGLGYRSNRQVLSVLGQSTGVGDSTQTWE